MMLPFLKFTIVGSRPTALALALVLVLPLFIVAAPAARADEPRGARAGEFYPTGANAILDDELLANQAVPVAALTGLDWLNDPGATVTLNISTDNAVTSGSLQVSYDGLTWSAVPDLVYSAGRVSTSMVEAKLNAGSFYIKASSDVDVRVVRTGVFSDQGANTLYGYTALDPISLADSTTTTLAAGQELVLTPASSAFTHYPGALMLQLAAVNPGAAGSLSVLPYSANGPGSGEPLLPFDSGVTTSTSTVVEAGADGAVLVRNNSAGSVALGVTMVGYYSYEGLLPVHMNAPAQSLFSSAALGSGSSINIQVAGSPGVPTGATAAVVRVSAINPSGNGYFLLRSTTAPTTPGTNFYSANVPLSTLETVRLDADGGMTLHNLGSTLDLDVTLLGYYVDAAAPDLGPTLPAPTGVTAVAGDEAAKVRWDTVVGASYYVVNSTPGDASTSVGPDTATASFDGLTNDTAYTFSVTAYDSYGRPGGTGTSQAATPSFGLPNPSDPYPVTDVAASALSGGAAISWSPSDDTAVDSYEITSSPDAHVYFADGDATGLAVYGLNNGDSYTFTVKALRTTDPEVGRASSPSNTVTPDAGAGNASAPASVTTVTTTPHSGAVTLGWVPAVDTTTPAAKYRVTYQVGAREILAASVSSGESSATAYGLNNDAAYTFSVTPVSALGVTGVPAVSGPVTPDATLDVPPGSLPAVTDLSALPNVNAATLSWSDPSGWSGSYVITQAGLEERPHYAQHAGNFTVYGLANDVQASFSIQTYDPTLKRFGSPSTIINVTPSGVADPAPIGSDSAPSNVVVQPLDRALHVSWDPYLGAAAQFRAVAQPGNHIVTSPAGYDELFIPGLINGRSYTVTVQAVDDQGRRGSASSPSTPVTPTHPPGLAAPTDLIGVPGDARVDLSWTAPAGSVSYYVVRPIGGSDPDGEWFVYGADAFTTIYGLENGTPYAFTVTAYDFNGQAGVISEPSVPVTPDSSIGKLPAPTNLSATSKDQAALLTWDPVSGARSYLVDTGSDQYYVDLDETQKLVSSLNPGQTYSFTVRAVDLQGVIGLPATLSFTASEILGQLPAPSPIAVVPVHEGARVSWEPVDDANLYRISTLPATRSFIFYPYQTAGLVTGLVNAEEYTIIVQTLDEDEAGGAKGTATVTPVLDAGRLSAPTGVTAEPRDNGAWVTWNPVADADHYLVVDAASGYARYAQSPQELVLGLNNSVSSDFYVTAVSADGLEGLHSQTVSVVPDVDGGRLPAPNGLRAFPRDHGATLSWDPIEDATGYQITLDNGASQFSPTSNALVKNLDNETAYSFTVAALTVDGTVGMPSAPSAPVTPPGVANSAVDGVVFDDVNGDGARQPTEPGVLGIEVQLMTSSGKTVSTFSDLYGEYHFTSLFADAYTVGQADFDASTRTTFELGGAGIIMPSGFNADIAHNEPAPQLAMRRKNSESSTAQSTQQPVERTEKQAPPVSSEMASEPTPAEKWSAEQEKPTEKSFETSEESSTRGPVARGTSPLRPGVRSQQSAQMRTTFGQSGPYLDPVLDTYADQTYTAFPMSDGRELAVSTLLHCDMRFDSGRSVYNRDSRGGICWTDIYVDGVVYSSHISDGFGNSSDRLINLEHSDGGVGTLSDPYYITNKVAAGSTGVTLTQTVKYVAGQDSFTTTTVVDRGTAADVKLYPTVYCVLTREEAHGIGSAAGSVGCGQGDEALISTPQTSGSAYKEDTAALIGARQVQGLHHDNQIRMDTLYKVAASLEWTPSQLGSYTYSSQFGSNLSQVDLPIVPDAQTYGSAGTCFCTDFNSKNPTRLRADPVNTATGSFTETYTDLHMPGLGVPFELQRSYNSADSHVGAFGRGWTFEYGAALDIAPTTITLKTGAGQETLYHATPSGWAGPAGSRSVLEETPNGFTLTARSGSTIEFDSSGRLTAMKDRLGDGLTFDYVPGLMHATDSAGRVIMFTYDSSNHITGVTLPDGRSVSYAYSNNLLASYTDASGATTTYHYTDDLLTSAVDTLGHTLFDNTYDPVNHRVVSQRDALGAETTFAWDDGTQTSTMTDSEGGVWTDVYRNNVILVSSDPLGFSTRYRYDQDLNVIQISDPLGRGTSMTYDVSGNMLTRTRANRIESWTYDTGNRPLSYVNPVGATTSYTYDTDGQLLSSTSPVGAVSAHTYDRTLRTNTVSDPLGNISSADYGPDGQVVRSTSGTGAVTTFSYDTTGRLISSVSPNGNSSGVPGDHTNTATYDALDRMLTKTDALGQTTTRSYDVVGHLTTVTDPLGRSTSYSRDALGRVTSETKSGGRVTSSTYDTLGRTTAVTTASGTTTYRYDAMGQLTSSTLPNGNVSGASANIQDDNTTRYQYDPVGQLYSTTTPDGAETVTQYDQYGQPTRVTRAYGTDLERTSVMEYDYAGRLLRMTAPNQGAISQTWTPDGLVASTTDPFNDTTAYDYDLNQNQVSMTLPGGETTTYAYDANGARTASTDPRGNLPGADPGAFTTHWTYDPEGRMVSSTTPTGAISSMAYDAVGHVTSMTDALRRTTNYDRDALGRTTAVTDPAGAMTSYNYNLAGDLSSRTDPLNHTTLYTHDNAGRLTATTTPMGRTTSASYDPNGQRTSLTPPASVGVGNTPDAPITYAYDAMGRLTTLNYSDATPDVFYDYDELGQRVSMSDGTGATNYEYDSLGSLSQASGPAGVVAYGYDALGRQASVSTTSTSAAPELRYTSSYDANGRLSEVDTITEPNGFGDHTSYVYDPAGNPTSMVNGSMTESRTYDADNRVTGLTHSTINGTVDTTTRSLNATGDPVTVQTTDVEGFTRMDRYDYNAAGSLTAWCQGGTGCADATGVKSMFMYDAAGNMTGTNYQSCMTCANSSRSYIYNADDQLTLSSKAGAPDVEFEYDLDGNQIVAGPRSTVFDQSNRPTSVTANGDTTSYQTNGDGDRVSATFQNSTTSTLWDTSTQDHRALRDATDGAGRNYAYGLDLLNQVDDAGGVQYFQHDTLGSVVGSLNGAGESVHSGSYTPWGTPTTTGMLSSFGFTGEQFSPTTGLLNLRARQYDPSQSRFTGADPLGRSTDTTHYNPYAYAQNNPLSFVDPAGTYEYTYEQNLGSLDTLDVSSAEEATTYLTTHLDTVFPFDTGGCRVAYLGQPCAFEPATLPILGMPKDNLYVNSITPTSLTLEVTQWDLGDPAGAQIIFNLCERDGDLYLQQRGKADTGLVMDAGAKLIAGATWDVQASNLSQGLGGKREAYKRHSVVVNAIRGVSNFNKILPGPDYVDTWYYQTTSKNMQWARKHSSWLDSFAKWVI